MRLNISLQTLKEDLLNTEKAIVFILRHYPYKISGASISMEMGISRKKLQRGFMQLTQAGVEQYIRNVRIERAKELLEENQETINAIMQQTGFRDVRHFRRVFVGATSTTPEEYRISYTGEHLLKISANNDKNSPLF